MLLFADHDDALDGALSTAPLAALYHLNAKFSRYERTSDLDALVEPGGDGEGYERGAWMLDGLPRVAIESDAGSLGMSLGTAIHRRRSVRRFADAPIEARALGTLLRFSAGVVDTGRPSGPRATPSGGAKYPVQLVACVRSVEGIPAGVYGYDARAAGLVPLKTGEESCDRVRAACFYPDIVAGAAVIVLVIAVLTRSTRKYRELGYRLAVQEAGHVAQNLTLVSTALGLGSVVLAGFDEHDVETFLGLDGETETLLSTVLVGHDPAAGHPAP